MDEDEGITRPSGHTLDTAERIKRVNNTKVAKSTEVSKGDKGEQEDKRGRDASLRSRLLSFSYNFIAGVLLLSFVGYKLDEYFENENHSYLLIGIFLGFFWSMYETFKLTRYLNK